MENYLGSAACSCGKEHNVAIDDVVVGKGVIARLPEFVAKYGAKKPFVLADCNTFKAAGEAVTGILKDNGINVKLADVMAITIDDEPGRAASAVKALSDAGVNILYMYSFLWKGKGVLTMRTDEVSLAEEVIQRNNIQLLNENEFLL